MTLEAFSLTAHIDGLRRFVKSCITTTRRLSKKFQHIAVSKTDVK
jgi:hypothetical protein